jgi:predicted transposase YdaD
MFDPTCKFLAESFPADFATWLVGEPVALTKLSPTELLLEPIRADSLILLERKFINQVLRREIMQQSVIYQEWKEEFLQEGRQEGKIEGEQSLILRQLTRRIGDVSPSLRSQIQSLSLAQLESLGEALLDFNDAEALVKWFEA